VQRKLLHNTSTSGDGIPTALLRANLSCVQWLHRTITAAWRSHSTPTEWKQAHMVALYKGSGSKLAASSHRGLSLLSTSGKAYVQLLHQRVRPQLLGSLHVAQCGFRPDRSTTDACLGAMHYP
jgi:hypothetical protein